MKNNIIKCCFITLGLCFYLFSSAQNISMEISASDRNCSFKGGLSGDFNQTSGFGYSNMNLIGFAYNQNNINALSAINVTYPIFNHFKSSGGLFYRSRNGIKPSFGLQYSIAKRNNLFSINPMINIWKNCDYVLFGSFERMLSVKGKIGFRAQTISLFTSNGHERTSLKSRLGLFYQKFQVGIAEDFGFSGPDFIRSNVFGFFLKSQLSLKRNNRIN